MFKEFYKSKTFWFNIITILLGIIEVVNKTYPISAQVLAMIMGFGNLILRLISGEQLTFGGRTIFGKKVGGN